MTHQLDNTLKWLVKGSRAEAALVWSPIGKQGAAVVLGSCPVPVLPGPMPCMVPAGAGTGAVVTDTARMVSLLPDDLLKELPAPPAFARSFPLADGLMLTVIWCDASASAELGEDGQRHALEEVTALAQLTRDVHFLEGDVERLRAVVNGLQDGVATLNPGLGLVAVNKVAGDLLQLPVGIHPEADFQSALTRLAQRASNATEISSSISRLLSDPRASIDGMWRFDGDPSHLWVVSKPVEHEGFRGRTWVFYDESASARVLESLAHTHDLLRASADGMLDPQVLLEAVRDSSGRITDFVFRDVNRATCRYLGLARDALIGHTVLETMPRIAVTGLLDRYVECVETHTPIIIDDVRYDNQILTGPRHYDIRGNHVGGDLITLTWRDVTQRVESLERIAASEQRFRLLAENVGDVVLHVRDGVIAWVSPSVEAALGAPPEHWVGRPVRDLVADEDHDAHDKVTWLADGRAVIPRGLVKAADGTRHWVHVHARAFHDAEGRPDGYTASFRVIDDEMTAIGQAEEALRRQSEADARYRRLIDNAPVAMCVADAEGRFEVVNDAMGRVFGYDAETMRAMDWRNLVAPETLESELTEYQKFLTGEIDVQRAVKECVRADGERIWGDFSISCLRTPAGELESFITQIVDITEQIRTQLAIEQARREQAASDARYRRIMDNSAVGISMVTPRGRFEIVNQALCDFYGYDEETLKSMTWQELTADDSLEEDLRRVDDVLAGRIDRYRLVKQYIHADGHLIWGDLTVSCLRDENGEVEYFVSQIIDITKEVETRRQVAQRDQQNRALAQRLQRQTDRLRSELKIAADYVSSLLPGDLDGPVQVTRRYLPSRELGGDCFDYRWIDDDHLMVYLIDVSGHGIAPALEAISVHNLLRSGALPTRTLRVPADVLAELNTKFPMDQHGGNYFTMWYGVYESSTRTLRYASAGHPPALAFHRPGIDPVRLTCAGLPVGMFPDTEFRCETYQVPPGAEIVVYSDGAFELPLPPDATWSLSDFIDLCTELSGSGHWAVDELANRLKARTVAGLLDDDCSLLLLRFP
jgi:sigma-B regulation protein RsbU (phosphoserine phosphatase)